jgi:hypothetical protein
MYFQSISLAEVWLAPALLDGIPSHFISFAQVTPEQVAAAVAKVVASEQGALQGRRYLFNQNILVGKVRCAAVSGGPSLQRLLASRANHEELLKCCIGARYIVHIPSSCSRCGRS